MSLSTDFSAVSNASSTGYPLEAPAWSAIGVGIGVGKVERNCYSGSYANSSVSSLCFEVAAKVRPAGLLVHTSSSKLGSSTYNRFVRHSIRVYFGGGVIVRLSRVVRDDAERSMAFLTIFFLLSFGATRGPYKSMLRSISVS